MRAQALIERSMLDSIAASFRELRYDLAASVSDGSILLWLAGAALLFLLFRRRR